MTISRRIAPRSALLALHCLAAGLISQSVASSAQARDLVKTRPAPQDAAEPSTKDDRSDRPWINRWAPEAGMHELGVLGGMMQINGDHELFQPNPALPDQGYQPLQPVSALVGARYGFYPAAGFGVEIEGGVMPTEIASSGLSATLWNARGSLVAQLSRSSIVPFVLAGAGTLGVNSGVLGRDIDPALHFGGGVKVNLSRHTQLRIDLRDVLSYQRGVGDKLRSNNFEVTAGFSMTLGRSRPTPPKAPERKDSDGDGYYDDEDMCPYKAETFNDFLDGDGCPETDRDGDGFWDQPDQDACPDEPETRNGFEDDDGCPDELPDEVEEFMGVIDGIHFEFDRDTIRPDSATVLDEAVMILAKYDSIRIEISGHTDGEGDAAYNVDLSQRRAESVRRYLVQHGIAGDRVETRGYGLSRPISENYSAEGRALNRRIEFAVMGQ